MDIWEKHYYACDCGTEVILLSQDKEDKGKFGIINFAIFAYGHYSNSTMCLRYRLKYMWHVLRTGNPYKDEIVLNYKTAKRLGQDLIKLTKENDNG